MDLVQVPDIARARSFVAALLRIDSRLFGEEI
jgi:hypothetical protein